MPLSYTHEFKRSTIHELIRMWVRFTLELYICTRLTAAQSVCSRGHSIQPPFCVAQTHHINSPFPAVHTRQIRLQLRRVEQYSTGTKILRHTRVLKLHQRLSTHRNFECCSATRSLSATQRRTQLGSRADPAHYAGAERVLCTPRVSLPPLAIRVHVMLKTSAKHLKEITY